MHSDHGGWRVGPFAAVAALLASPALAQVPAPPAEAAQPAAAVPPLPAAPGTLPLAALLAPPLAAPALTPSTELGRLVTATAGTRLAARIQNGHAPEKLDDLALAGELQVMAAGQVHPLFKWQAGFVGTFGGLDETGTYEAAGRARLLELVAKVPVAGWLNLWVGRMLVPTDRSTLSTPWSAAPWTLPGEYLGGRPRLAPRQDDLGRGDGAALWGQLWGGSLKYHLGAFGLDNPLDSVLYTARVALNLLDPEPGFRSASTYYGKNIFALGVGAQHQADGSVGFSPLVPGAPAYWDDYTQLHADLLVEQDLGSIGVLDFEAAFHRVWGDHEPAEYHWFALFSYLLPIEVGIGRFQPLLRFQHAKLAVAEDRALVFDSQLGYVIHGSNTRLALLYQYSRVAGATGNAIIAGLQLVSR